MDEPNYHSSDPPVTVMISRRVKPGREVEFEEFLRGVSIACSQHEGHLGTTIFRPPDAGKPEYQVIFKFDHQSNLNRWETSAERQKWFALAAELTEDTPKIQILTGLETWFTLPGQASLIPPPRYKMALVSWLGVFPLITLIFTLLGNVLSPLPLVLRTFLVTAIAISTMTYVVMPRMTRLFSWWLYPTAVSDPSPSGKSPLALTPGEAPILDTTQPFAARVLSVDPIQNSDASAQNHNDYPAVKT